MKEEGGWFLDSKGGKSLLSFAHKSFSEVKIQNTFRDAWAEKYVLQATQNASNIQFLGRMLVIYTIVEGDNWPVLAVLRKVV